MYALFYDSKWLELTNLAHQEEQWANDPNAFIAQDSEETILYSARVAGSDLLGVRLF